MRVPPRVYADGLPLGELGKGLRMAQTSFSLATTITAPPELIRQMLADFRDLGRFHPLIVGVAEIEPDTSSFGTPRHRFQVTDRMRVGPSLVKFTYLATKTDAPDGSLYCEAFQSPGIHLMSTYTFTAEGGHTTVTERTTVEGTALLLGYVKRQAQEAHRVTLTKIKTYLEASPTSPTTEAASA